MSQRKPTRRSPTTRSRPKKKKGPKISLPASKYLVTGRLALLRWLRLLSVLVEKERWVFCYVEAFGRYPAVSGAVPVVGMEEKLSRMERTGIVCVSNVKARAMAGTATFGGASAELVVIMSVCMRLLSLFAVQPARQPSLSRQRQAAQLRKCGLGARRNDNCNLELPCFGRGCVELPVI